QGMHVAVAVGVALVRPGVVGGVALLLAAAGLAGARVGVLGSGQQVVGVDVAAAARRFAVDVFRLLGGAARFQGGHRQRVVIAIVGIFRGLVAARGRRAVGVVLDGLREPALVVVGILRDQPTRVGDAGHPAGAVVRLRGHQRGVRGGRHGGRPA